jgi:hypothetical protein
MAITPEQATHLSPVDYEVVQAMERDIDSKLLLSWSELSDKFDYQVPPIKEKGARPKIKVILEVQRRYEVAGWRVTLTREGTEVYAITLDLPHGEVRPVLPQAAAHRQLMSNKDNLVETEG